jgi:RNA 3'-phosphate cyclase
MIEINGESGGGQILRTALGLSALTQKPFTITNIRKSRPQPGLKDQHLQGLLAVKKLTDAEIDAKIGTTELTFTPKTIRKGNLKIKLNTAGSLGMILQVLLIPAIKTDLNISVKGGSIFSKWAPPVYHFENILLPLLDYPVKINIKKHGFYPKGGAELEVFSPKTELKPINLEKGEPIELNGISIASTSLKAKKVAERQANEAKKILSKHFDNIKIKTQYVEALNPGSGIQLTLKTTKTIYGGDAVGERGKTSEKVAQTACDNLIQSYEKGTVDKYTADMLIPYLALAGGSYTAPEITNHIKTNINTIEKFLDVKFKIKGNKISI